MSKCLLLGLHPQCWHLRCPRLFRFSFACPHLIHDAIGGSTFRSFHHAHMKPRPARRWNKFSRSDRAQALRAERPSGAKNYSRGTVHERALPEDSALMDGFIKLIFQSAV